MFFFFFILFLYFHNLFLFIFIFYYFFANRINELLASLHGLRYNKNKNDNSEEKNDVIRPKIHFADLSKRLLSENIPLDSSSTAVIDYLLSNLRKDEERAVELGKGIYNLQYFFF